MSLFEEGASCEVITEIIFEDRAMMKRDKKDASRSGKIKNIWNQNAERTEKEKISDYWEGSMGQGIHC